MKQQLRELLDRTEAAYRDCWETLLRMKMKDTSTTLDYRQKLLDFQSTLAGALLQLDEFHRRIRSDERALVTRKNALSPSWFRRRMRTLAHYRDALKGAIEIGHGLGDSFAWLFYVRDRQSLKAHLKVSGQTHLPPGIGGRGELEFLRQVKGIGNQLAIYHGTTSFLRIGDVSLFDLTDGSLVGIGELKTAEVEPGRLEITLHMVTSRQPEVPNTAQPVPRARRQLPQANEQRLRRQMTAMAKTLRDHKQEPRDSRRTIHSGAHLAELDALYQRIRPRRVAYQQAGNGLVLAGMRTGKVGFATRLLERSHANFGSRFAAVPKEALKTMLADSADNALLLGHLDLRLQGGATPIFWWPVRTDLLRDLIFGDVIIVTIYNPAHFFGHLRALGFGVEGDPKSGYRVSKVVDGHEVRLHAVEYFLDAIQRNLLTEHAALAAIRRLLEPIESGKALPNSRIEMEMLMYWL